MLSFIVVNLVIPGSPIPLTGQQLVIKTPHGDWTLTPIQPPTGNRVNAVLSGRIEETHVLEHQASSGQGAATLDAAMSHVTPILLGATCATSLSVTVRKSSPFSDLQLAGPSNQWPRERGLEPSVPLVKTAADFTAFVQNVVSAWPGRGRDEKALLLIHHWLDALACWSLEDLYLSATTLLQIIGDTEEHRLGKKDMPFYDSVVAAAERFNNAPILSTDFKKMRNDLIHDGVLSGTHFPGRSKAECEQVAADVLNWFDSYFHAALALGVPQSRFAGTQLSKLNAFTVE